MFKSDSWLLYDQFLAVRIQDMVLSLKMQNQYFTDRYIVNWGSVKSWILWLQIATGCFAKYIVQN